MNDVGSPIRYVIVRRVGDFDEYLQEDGNFGNLTRPRLAGLRRPLPRRRDARLLRPRARRVDEVLIDVEVPDDRPRLVSLEIWRLP